MIINLCQKDGAGYMLHCTYVCVHIYVYLHSTLAENLEIATK